MRQKWSDWAILGVDLLACAITGTRLLIAGRWEYPGSVAAGLLCLLAGVCAVIHVVWKCRGKTGRVFDSFTIVTFILHLPVLFYTIVLLLMLFGLDLLPPPQG